jgi:protein-L-isoaspartate O-methyltransferase
MKRENACRCRLLLWLWVLVTPSTLAAQAADSLPPASAIFARHIEAIGGKEAILHHPSLHMQLAFKGPYATADVHLYAAYRGRFLFRTVRDDSIVSERGSDGELAWVNERDRGPRLLRGFELATALHEADFFAGLYDLYDMARLDSVTVVGVTELEGRQCYEVELLPTAGRPWVDYFDVETGLKAGSERTGVGESFVFTHTELLSDYQEFDGVLLPTRRTWRYAGWEFEQVLTLESVTFDGVPDTVFARPRDLAERAWPFADRLADLLALEKGHTVADIGAGGGPWSLELARRVGPAGHVLATELDPALLEEMRKAARHAGLTTLSPILVDQSYTGLPRQCCDRILVRFVYHEFTDPDVMNAGLLRAVKPGGLVVLIDALAEEENLTNGRGNHTILPDVLIEELVGAGFELVKRTDAYDGHDNRFAVVVRRPM